MERSSYKWIRFILFLMTISAVIIGGYVYYKNRQQLVSPVPPEPNFQVIFYTPTPGVTVSVSTPSATPKVKKPQPSPTIKTVASPSAIPKISPSPTVKPTSNP